MVRSMVCVLVLGIIIVSTSGCASIINGTSQRVTINSTPSGADVKITDGRGRLIMTQKTPCTVKLDRGRGFFSNGKYTLLFEKDGYSSTQYVVKGRVSAWYIGNVAFGLAGILIGGVIADPLTGGMWTLDPDSVNAFMVQESAAADEKSFSRQFKEALVVLPASRE